MLRIKSVLLIAVTFILSSCSAPLAGQFRSPEKASEALLLAARAQDDAALDQLFGEGFMDYIGSGDAVADGRGLEQLAMQMEESTEITTRSDGARILLTGKRRSPFPVPLKKEDGFWIFDGTEGAESLIERRIGENELRAIKVAEFYADAQKLYFSKDRDGNGMREYARKFTSSASKKDGLYWESSDAAFDPSPFGPLIGIFLSQGYDPERKQSGDPIFRGYHYRILESQGAHAPGGSKSYLDSKGRMTKGFALLCYPTNWGISGIMSFLVGPAGEVFQKNLGERTEEEALKLTKFDPDSSWNPARAVSE